MVKVLEGLSSKTMSAPMAATTNIPFRKICKKYGASVLFSEMINSDTLVRGCNQTLRLAIFDETERPIALQIFGHNPNTMAEAAKIIEELKPDIIDINAGCPVQKINRYGAGVALLKDLNVLGLIIRSVVDAVKIPVSVKIRTGYTKKIIVKEVAKVIEDSGACFVTVHARTRIMPYSEPSNWDWILETKKSVNIPVVGNGDIFYATDAYDMMDKTGCDYVSIARGALGNPWLFRDSNHYIKTREILPQVTLDEKLSLILEHIAMSLKEHGEILALKEMKKHVCWYTRHLPDAEEFRSALFKTINCSELVTIIQSYFEKIKNKFSDNYLDFKTDDKKFKDRVCFWLLNDTDTIER
jgi:tRNA-dihydrouridine synthase B